MTQEVDIHSVYESPNNLVDLFEMSLAKWPDRRLFGTKNLNSGQYEWMTRSEVAQRVHNLRGALARLGLSKGDKVGVIVNNCVEWFICEQASHGLGAAFVPMYEKELKKIWHYIVSDAAVKFLFVRDRGIYEQVKEFKAEIPTLNEIFIIFGEEDNSLKALEEMGGINSVPSIKPHWSDLAFYHLHLRHHRRSEGRDAFSWKPDTEHKGGRRIFQPG